MCEICKKREVNNGEVFCDGCEEMVGQGWSPEAIREMDDECE